MFIAETAMEVRMPFHLHTSASVSYKYFTNNLGHFEHKATV